MPEPNDPRSDRGEAAMRVGETHEANATFSTVASAKQVLGEHFKIGEALGATKFAKFSDLEKAWVQRRLRKELGIELPKSLRVDESILDKAAPPPPPRADAPKPETPAPEDPWKRIRGFATVIGQESTKAQERGEPFAIQVYLDRYRETLGDEGVQLLAKELEDRGTTDLEEAGEEGPEADPGVVGKPPEDEKRSGPPKILRFIYQDGQLQEVNQYEGEDETTTRPTHEFTLPAGFDQIKDDPAKVDIFLRKLKQIYLQAGDVKLKPGYDERDKLRGLIGKIKETRDIPGLEKRIPLEEIPDELKQLLDRYGDEYYRYLTADLREWVRRARRDARREFQNIRMTEELERLLGKAPEAASAPPVARETEGGRRAPREEEERRRAGEATRRAEEERLAREKKAQPAAMAVSPAHAVLPPTPPAEHELVARRIEELREKVRMIGYEVEPGKMFDKETLKEKFGAELREAIAALMAEEGVFWQGDTDRGREKQVVKKLAETLGHTYDLNEEQLRDIYLAAKSELVESSKGEEIKSFWLRALRPKTKKGIALKAAYYGTVGVAGTLAWGWGGLVATGAIRQVDILANSALDRKLLNQYRERKKNDDDFLEELQDRFAALAVETKRRALEKADVPIAGDAIENSRKMEELLQERTQKYFTRINDYIQREDATREAPYRLIESARHGIAQRLAVHYALDDVASVRERELEARRTQDFHYKIWNGLKKLDGRLAGNTLHDKTITGAAMTGVGLGLALAARGSSWGRRIAAAYGGWKIGGAIAEWRGRKELSPILSTEKGIDEALQLRDAARRAKEQGQFNVRAVALQDLEKKINELKARLEKFPSETARAKFLEFKETLRQLQFELVTARFEEAERAQEVAQVVSIQERMAQAIVKAQGLNTASEAGRKAVAAERRKLAASGLLWRMFGAAAGVALSEGIVRMVEAYQSRAEAERAAKLKEWMEEIQKKEKAKAVPPLPVAKSEDPFQKFMTEKKLVAALEGTGQEHWKLTRGADGSIHLTAKVGAKGNFAELQHLLRRALMQEHADGAVFGKVGRVEIENAVANYTKMIRDNVNVANFSHADVDGFVNYNPKTGEIDITYRGPEGTLDFEDHAARVLAHADQKAPDMIQARGAGLATIDNTSTDTYQEILNHKYGESSNAIAATEVKGDLDVIAANKNVELEQHARELAEANAPTAALEGKEPQEVFADSIAPLAERLPSGGALIMQATGADTGRIELSWPGGKEVLTVQGGRLTSVGYHPLSAGEQPSINNPEAVIQTIKKPRDLQDLFRPREWGGVAEGGRVKIGDQSFSYEFLKRRADIPLGEVKREPSTWGVMWRSPEDISLERHLASSVAKHPDTASHKLGDWLVRNASKLYRFHSARSSLWARAATELTPAELPA